LLPPFSFSGVLPFEVTGFLLTDFISYISGEQSVGFCFVLAVKKGKHIMTTNNTPVPKSMSKLIALASVGPSAVDDFCRTVGRYYSETTRAESLRQCREMRGFKEIGEPIEEKVKSTEITMVSKALSLNNLALRNNFSPVIPLESVTDRDEIIGLCLDIAEEIVRYDEASREAR
jgi:hypothetical protein